MIKTKTELRDCLRIEKNIYGLSKMWWFFSLFGVSEKSIIWRYQKNLRMWEYHLNNQHRFRCLLYRFKTTKIGLKYGMNICPNCFDIGLKIAHLGPILVNSQAKIGKYCLVHINTAIVATSGLPASPVIGNNCKIGIGAVLIGAIVLGNDIAVGAGSIVTKSFETNHITIAGVPAKIISDKAVL